MHSNCSTLRILYKVNKSWKNLANNLESELLSPG